MGALWDLLKTLWFFIGCLLGVLFYLLTGFQIRILGWSLFAFTFVYHLLAVKSAPAYFVYFFGASLVVLVLYGWGVLYIGDRRTSWEHVEICRLSFLPTALNEKGKEGAMRFVLAVIIMNYSLSATMFLLLSWWLLWHWGDRPEFKLFIELAWKFTYTFIYSSLTFGALSVDSSGGKTLKLKERFQSLKGFSFKLEPSLKPG